jgi:hypothetical protein
MFGGVVFGKATYGLSRRADIFISYQWGRAVSTDASDTAGFETQAIVAGLKTSLERHTRLTCWFDLDCMGAGVDIFEAMAEGVTRADVFWSVAPRPFQPAHQRLHAALSCVHAALRAHPSFHLAHRVRPPH